MSYTMSASGLQEMAHDMEIDNLKKIIKEQKKLLRLYKELVDAYGEYNSTFDSEGNRHLDNLTEIYRLKIQIKEGEKCVE